MSEEKPKVPIIQLLLGFVFVIVVGFIVTGVSMTSKEETAAGQMLFQGTQLTKYSVELCSKVINEVMGTTVYSPSQTTGDRVTAMKIIWEGGSSDKFKKAECTYRKGIGIESLIIDGVERKPDYATK